MPVWDPQVYSAFKAERDRPALDLLVQIPADLEPREIWDLGCGPGEHAALLARRHPRARVRGLDSSPQMLAQARARPEPVEWIEGDIAGFSPERPADLLFTNAALQWLPDHAELFPRLVSRLAPGGVLACQMPRTWSETWHAAMRALAAEPPFRAPLAGVRDIAPVADPAAYHAWLAPLAEADIWTTTYLHALTGPDPIVRWMEGTGLRPYLEALAGPDRERFRARYAAAMREAFPPRADGVTLFPFPRLFILARRR